MTQGELFPHTTSVKQTSNEDVQTCKKCGETLPQKKFSRHNRSKNLRDHRCKKCVQEYQRGLYSVQKTARLQGKIAPKHCEICGISADEQRILLDHCHDTLKHRGWLCHPCNTSIGHLGDNIIGLRRALLYLHRFEEETDETNT